MKNKRGQKQKNQHKMLHIHHVGIQPTCYNELITSFCIFRTQLLVFKLEEHL